MTLKERVFKWFDEHPEELRKTGYDSNAELRKAFPGESRKTLSMYKMKYKRAEKEKPTKVETPDKPKEKKVKDYTENKAPTKQREGGFEFNFELIYLAIPVVIFLFWMIFKPKKR